MIVGLNGPMRSGKSEVARILAENFGFKELSFADKLKESAAAVFPNLSVDDLNDAKNDPNSRVTITWAPEVGEGQWLREISISARTYMQRYGTEAHRIPFGDTFWIEQLFAQLDPKENYVISDARMENEILAIKEHGGKIMQVRRPGCEYSKTHLTEAAPNPDLIDYLLHNDGTLDDLEWKVNALVKAEKLANQGQLDDSDILVPSPLQQPERDSWPLIAS